MTEMPLHLHSYPLILFVAICSVRTEDRRPSTVAAARPCARRPWRSSNPAPARRQPSATSPAGHGAPTTPHRRDGGPRDLARRSWRSGNPASG